MFIELHILQNFPPSNLNRSDTGAPKDCTFGGYRRARISSQCIKRGIRKHPSFTEAILSAGGNLGTRTKRILNSFREKLDADHSHEEIEQVVETLLGAVKLTFDSKKGTADENAEQPLKKTQYLLYLSASEIDALAHIAKTHWDDLISVAKPDDEGDKKAKKKQGKQSVSKELQKKIASALRDHPALAADIALFGRMMADDKDMNIDAACQVAHAISTNRINSMEMDFFTAVDDLLPSEESGSDMMGMVQFNSACFYRYSQINLDILAENLGQDRGQCIAAVDGFLKATVQSIPTGMQNSMAAQTPPCYVRVMVRSSGAPWSLANAFVKPVHAETAGLTANSIAALEKHFSDLQRCYGNEGFELDKWMSLETPLDENNLSLPDLLTRVKSTLENHWAGA